MSDIESVQDFFKKTFNEDGYPYIYRGHSKSNRKLEPSIAREKQRYQPNKNWNEFEQSILNDFKKYSQPFIQNKNASELETLTTAQHSGCPTRLLEWTMNPLIALFFAVEKTQHHNSDGVVYMVSPHRTVEFNSNNYNVDQVHFCETPYIDGSKTSPGSYYSVFPLPANDEEFPVYDSDLLVSQESIMGPMVEVIIPSTSKHRLILELNNMGISRQTLFPGLYGISRSITSRLRLNFL